MSLPAVVRRPMRAVVCLMAALTAASLITTGVALADSGSPSPATTSAAPTPGVAKHSAKDEVTFGIQPAGANRADGRPFYSWGATPGSSLADHVALLNYSDQPLVLSVYATDAFTASDGSYGLLPTRVEPTQAGSWISLQGDTTDIRVPPRRPTGPGERVIPVSAVIPADATPGDHAAGIMAVLTSAGQASTGANLTLEQRVGTRVFIRVSGDLSPSLAVENLHATYHGVLSPFGAGSATVTYTLHNTGNTRLGGRGRTTITGFFGDRAVDGPQLPLLLPGATVDVSVRVPDVYPQLWMKAGVTVTPVPVADDQLPAVPQASASVGLWAVPWTLIAVVVLVLLAVFGYWRWRRRGGSVDPPPGEPQKTRDQQGVPS